MRKLVKAIIYLLLVTGAAVFSFPFLWMTATINRTRLQYRITDAGIIAVGKHMVI